jgi:hypothetical protein
VRWQLHLDLVLLVVLFVLLSALPFAGSRWLKIAMTFPSFRVNYVRYV